jgi:hypothetical protein
MLEVKKLSVGTVVADMHYGWTDVRAAYDVGTVIKVAIDSEFAHAMHRVLQQLCKSYTNKYLVVIGYDIETDHYVAAYVYDLGSMGVCQIRNRATAPNVRT